MQLRTRYMQAELDAAALRYSVSEVDTKPTTPWPVSLRVPVGSYMFCRALDSGSM